MRDREREGEREMKRVRCFLSEREREMWSKCCLGRNVKKLSKEREGGSLRRFA